MNIDNHLIFEAFQNRGIRISIIDSIEDKQEGTSEPGYNPFKTTVKQFDAKHVARALIKHVYGKYDQHRVEDALQGVLDSMEVNPYGAKTGIIELRIDEFPTDGMDHYIEAKIVGKEENAESADEKKERVQRGWQINKDRWAKWKKENPEAAAKHAAKKAGSENAENEPHGYPQGMTAIQNLVLNELKKKGFTLAKISHADKDRDKYPTVFMHKQSGPMHTVAEVDGMGSVNDKPYKEYLADLKNAAYAFSL